MTLARYTDLIKCLPYLDQAFETKKRNWPVEEGINPVFREFHHKCFLSESYKLSRAELFQVCKCNFTDAIFSIIFWGYPRNMRGNNFQLILKSLEEIKHALAEPRNLSASGFQTMCNSLQKTGVGLSTLSKFLYFFEYRLEGRRCLILDRRIMDTINHPEGFSEMKDLSLTGISDFNKNRKYVAYLQLMEDLSRNNGYMPDQLEFFLFSMGMNLKPSKGPAFKHYSLT